MTNATTYDILDNPPDPESAALGLSPWPRSDRPCGLARPPCGASPRRQLHHLIVDRVGDVEVAATIHRHTVGVVDAGERQHRLGGRARRQLHRPNANVGDIGVAGGAVAEDAI